MDGFLDVVENGRLIGWDERERFEYWKGWRCGERQGVGNWEAAR